MVLGTFKMPPRHCLHAKVSQETPQEAPKRHQDAPVRPQDAFWGTSTVTRSTQDAPKRLPRLSRSPPSVSEVTFFVLKISKYEKARTPRKLRGFEHFQKASNALFGHQKWPQEAPRSPPRDPMTPPRRPQDVSHAHQNVPLRLPRGPRRPETFQDAANTYGDIPNETRFPSLASQVSSAAPKSVKKHWFLQGFWLFGPSKKCKKGGGPKMGPKRPPRRFLGPQKWPQEAPKRPPGGAQDAPRGPQDAPKRALGAPEPPPGAPKTAPRRPQEPPDRSPAPSKLHFCMKKMSKTRKRQNTS